MKLRYLMITLTLFFTLSLTGCSASIWGNRPPPDYTTQGIIIGGIGGAVAGSAAGGGAAAPLGATVGGIWFGAFGNILEHHLTIVQRLARYGVVVIQIGDDLKIILPSDRFFFPQSPNLVPVYYHALNDIAILIRQFNKINIDVAGYTDQCGAWQRNLVLSRLQAISIANYLWKTGVDARLMGADGYGGAHPVANNLTGIGQSMNRRIEITLRKIIYDP